MSFINRLFYNYCYYLYFLAVGIRIAMGQAPTSLPTAPLPAPVAPFPAPAAPLSAPLGPAPAGPTNITAILEKPGSFNTLMRLMMSTQLANRINIELNDTNDALTIFAPTDGAFSALSPGTINGLNDQEKTNLVLFHIVPQYIPSNQFQTVTNPLRTQAGDVGPYDYPLNVTTSTNNTVTVSSGIDNSTLAGTIYSDGQLAVYQINKVLLPMGIFGPKPPAPAPAPVKPKKTPAGAVTYRPPALETTSGGMGLRENVVVALVGAAVGALWL
ncbi:fasciclin-like arabinogalactan protein 12 [Cinnamomum micranthum f. kanehirae]|uniref:Fasciclin-like arabinogalactan protein 12 n=1 Tax=Cinnamomum micranthum f. kanehirae TaxID=337451 RepID=A0A3S3NI54_9MAGN|nr:fasciclin-like arabinogalactan protein 12 [Cinnamomum micranthum f. kanehirae]